MRNPTIQSGRTDAGHGNEAVAVTRAIAETYRDAPGRTRDEPGVVAARILWTMAFSSLMLAMLWAAGCLAD